MLEGCLLGFSLGSEAVQTLLLYQQSYRCYECSTIVAVASRLITISTTKIILSIMPAARHQHHDNDDDDDHHHHHDHNFGTTFERHCRCVD